jgi:AcrR family transcriptional regulator
MSTCSYLQGKKPEKGPKVSPRGVVNPEIRQQLFQAAATVLGRDGPGGLSGRAVTREAGCATGLLYNHFGDFDTFLGEFIADRLRPLAESTAALPARAGHGTVAGNLTDFALARLGSEMLEITGLVLARPALLALARDARKASGLALNQVEPAVTSYLNAERELGRIAADTDTEAVTLALLGAVHQLLLISRTGSSRAADRMRRVVAMLARAITVASP